MTRGSDPIRKALIGSADPEEEWLMAMKQEFQKLVEDQIAVWQGQLGDYQGRMAQAGADARVDFEKGVASLRDNAERGKKLLGEVQSANEAAWKDMQGASQKALEELQKGWADALKRFG
jgi:hypothetical protein